MDDLSSIDGDFERAEEGLESPSCSFSATTEAVEVTVKVKDADEEMESDAVKEEKQVLVDHNFSVGRPTRVVDHFSLARPTSQIIFCQDEKTVVNTVVNVGKNQIILETDQESNEVSARQIVQESPGLFVVRAAYTLIAFQMSGFLLVFSTQLVLSLFLALMKHSGRTNDNDFSFPLFFGTLLAIPAYLFALANALTIAVAFTMDIWNGNIFMKTILKWKSVAIDWLTTTIFLFVPLIVGGKTN